MDAQHLNHADEDLVRAALQAAYPSERPVFSQRRGEQIIRAAAVEQSEERPRHPFVGSRVAACVAAAFTLFAGTAGAAGAALPGQRLYPLKLAVERAMVFATNDDEQAARLELEFAERRLEEADAVEAQSDDDVSTSLAQHFHEHLNAAEALAGDDVAGEVEQLERTRREQGTSGIAAPVQEQPAPTTPEVAVAPAPVPTASPSPTATATPLPSESISPGPSALPSPAPMAEVEPSIPPNGLLEPPAGDVRTSGD